MNLATLETPIPEAKAKLDEYRNVLAAERSTEDDALAMAYRAIVRGSNVISLPQTIEAGGFFENGLPRIAIVRADATECWIEVQSYRWRNPRTSYVFASDRRSNNRGAQVGADTVRVELPHREVEGPLTSRGHTIVPLIPPAHRPKPNRLRHRHILWEVEEWSPVPPKDPALLQHLRGDLWAVLSVWDLTELERAVLSSRNTNR